MAEVFRHLIATGWQTRPYTQEDIGKTEKWFVELVDLIDMKMLIPPKVVYCDTLGNEGITGICCIDTSHAAGHWWSGTNPFLRLDLFSCKWFDTYKVFEHIIKGLDVTAIDWTLIDRSNDRFVTTESGSYSLVI